MGTVYWYTIHYPDGLLIPLVNRSTTTEIDPPFRHGRCAILRLPLTRWALVVGFWEESFNADQAIERALSMRVIEDNGVRWEEDLV